MPQAKRTPVGTPLSPAVLHDLGAIYDYQIFDEPLDPNESYTNTYRIWVYHGYRERGNDDRGLLKVSRLPSPDPDRFTLEIAQKVVNDKGVLHTYTASVLSRNDTLSSPECWKLLSEFTRSDGQLIPDLHSEESFATSSDSLSKGPLTVTPIASGVVDLTLIGVYLMLSRGCRGRLVNLFILLCWKNYPNPMQTSD